MILTYFFIIFPTSKRPLIKHILNLISLQYWWKQESKTIWLKYSIIPAKTSKYRWKWHKRMIFSHVSIIIETSHGLANHTKYYLIFNWSVLEMGLPNHEMNVSKHTIKNKQKYIKNTTWNNNFDSCLLHHPSISKTSPPHTMLSSTQIKRNWNKSIKSRDERIQTHHQKQAKIA